MRFLFRLVILFEICWGAHAWFTWWADSSDVSTYIALFCLVIISMIYRNVYQIKLNKSKYVLLAFFFFLLAHLFATHFAILGMARCLLTLYPIWVLISDKPEIAKGHLSFVVKTLSIIFVFGLIEFFLFNLYPIPSFIIQYGDNINYVFQNYGFYLRNIGHDFYYSGADTGFQRFTSVFLEPGYLSAMSVFLLYALRFDLTKRENRILLYTILFSLSLAGYIMLIVAYFFHRLLERKKIWGLLTIPLILLSIYYIALKYNNGDNYLNSLIVERLMPDEERGITGNNRTSDLTRAYFYEGLLTGDSFFGLGAKRVESINGGRLSNFDNDAINGTGAIYFFVVKGIFAALFYLLFYIFIARSSKTSPYSVYFVLLIMICFIQASYPDSTSWVYPFILGLQNFKNTFQTQLNSKRMVGVANV